MSSRIICKSNRRSVANFAIAIGLVWLSYMLFSIYQEERELWVLALFLFSLAPLAVCLDELINEIYVEKESGYLIVRPSTFVSITKTKRFPVKDIKKAYKQKKKFKYNGASYFNYNVAVLLQSGEKKTIINARNEKDANRLSGLINKKMRS